MTRLDIVLSEKLGSRSKASDAIKSGRIKVNSKIIKKPSFNIEDNDIVEIQKIDDDFVSRAGHKLQAAFGAFHIDISNQVILDIGASTGGFTDVCLRHNARKVYALDVGHLQLDKKIENDKRVIKIEGFNARNISKDIFDDKIDFICMDVSFISCKTILKALFDQLDFKHMAILIKPQFECGAKFLNKHGVLTNETIQNQIVIDIERYVLRKFRKVQTIKSPIKGRSGNQEFILYAYESR